MEMGPARFNGFKKSIIFIIRVLSKTISKKRKHIKSKIQARYFNYNNN